MSGAEVSLQEAARLRSLAGRSHGSAPMIFCWEIRGKLNLRDLASALCFLAERHEVLRRFYSDSGSGTAAEVPLRLTYQMAGAEDEAHARMLAALREPFVLDDPPLWRVVLTRTAADHHLFGLAFDHLIVDRMSTDMLIDALGKLYLAVRTGVGLARGAEPKPYSSFPIEQRAALAGKWGRARRAYWREATERWGQYPPACPARLDTRRTDADTPNSMIRHHLPETRIRDTVEVGAASGLTEFALVTTALLAGFAEVSGKRVTGLVSDGHGRCLPGYWRTAGLFAHGIPVYRDTATDVGTLPEQAVEVQRRLHGILAHSLPLRAVDPVWNDGLVAGSDPPTCVLYVTNTRTMRNLSLPGLDVRHVDLERAAGAMVRTRLTTICAVQWLHGPDGVRLTAQFDPRVYEQSLLDAVLCHVRTLFTS